MFTQSLPSQSRGSRPPAFREERAVAKKAQRGARGEEMIIRRFYGFLGF